MKIDITKLLTGYIDLIEIKENVIIPFDLYKSTLITELTDIHLDGDITINEEDEIVLNGTLKGTMILPDDLTLQPVNYQFETKIEENMKKSQNILDITEVLWQNILVEIPSKVRSTDENIFLEGDGWRVISEDEFDKIRNNANNPFANLEELLNNNKEDR